MTPASGRALRLARRAVRDERARLEERAEGVRAVDLAGPEALREVAIRRRMAELHRAGDAELRESAHVLRREALRVLDPVAQSERFPRVAGLLEGVERLTVRPVADRVHTDRPAEAGAFEDDLGELLAARDHDPRAVEHPRGLRAERPVHERLQVADTQEVVADPGVDPERVELGKAFVRDRPPHAQREALALVDALEDPRRAEPAVLVVDRDDAAARCDPKPLTRSVDELVLARHREPGTELPRRLLAQDPVGLPAASRSTTPPSTSRSPSAWASAAELSQAEW